MEAPAPAGGIVLFATSPGTTASDGRGDNGLFTKHLLEALKEPLTLHEAFMRVVRAVSEATGARQRPQTLYDRSLAPELVAAWEAEQKFTEEQMDWLRMIRDHLATSFTIERDDLDLAPFDSKGGMGQMYALFGDSMDAVMAEMNEALSA